MFQPVLAIPMQQVTAEVAVPLEVQGTVDIPMQQWPKYVFGSIHGSLPVVQCAISGYVGYSITTSLPGVQSALAVINGAAITAHGVLPGLQAAIAVDRPAEIAARLPQVRSAMVCVAGPAASLDAELPLVGANLLVLAGPAIRIAGTIPGMSASIAGSAVAVGTLRGTLAAPRAAINAELKEVYAEYADRGFEIYQIGVDVSKDIWINAVQEQQLPWISVCDFRGRNSPALGLYNVQKLPANFLIDREGIVVARDLYGTGLQRALEAQFE
jgi:hypothetical protein